jgi:hypothetical protein
VDIAVDLDDEDLSTIRALVDDLIRQCDEVSTTKVFGVGASPIKTAVRKSNRGRVEQAATDEERNGVETGDVFARRSARHLPGFALVDEYLVNRPLTMAEQLRQIVDGIIVGKCFFKH